MSVVMLFNTVLCRLAIIYLGHHHRYKALNMSEEIAKRDREAGETAVKRDITSTQSDTASLMSATHPKKTCLGRGGRGRGQ